MWKTAIGALVLAALIISICDCKPFGHHRRSRKGHIVKIARKKTIKEPLEDPGALAQEEAAEEAAEGAADEAATTTQKEKAKKPIAAAAPAVEQKPVDANAASGPPLHCPSPCPQQCATQGCNPSCCMQNLPVQPQGMMCGGASCMPQMPVMPAMPAMPSYGSYGQPCGGAMPGSMPCVGNGMDGMAKVTVTKPEILPLPPNAPFALPPGMAVTGVIPYINGVPQLPGIMGMGNAIPGSQLQSAMQNMGVPQMPQQQSCPSVCSQQCAPSCSHQCCGPLPSSQAQQAGCPSICSQTCAQECSHSCCGPMQQQQQQQQYAAMPQMMMPQMPMQMPMQMPQAQAGQAACPSICSTGCAPACPRVCCGPGQGR